jgi:hypothetical protein
MFQWLYMGTRLDHTIIVSSVSITGADAGLFTLDGTDSIEFGRNSCEKLRISFSSPSTLSSTPIDAVLVLEWSEIGSDGIVKPSTTTIQLSMKDYNFNRQKLGYPYRPPPTMPPTISPAPTATSTTNPPTAPKPSAASPTSSPATTEPPVVDTDGTNGTTDEPADATEDKSEQQQTTTPDCLEGCSGSKRFTGASPFLFLALLYLL